MQHIALELDCTVTTENDIYKMVWYLRAHNTFFMQNLEKTAIIQLTVMSRTSIFISLCYIRFSDMWSSQYSFTEK